MLGLAGEMAMEESVVVEPDPVDELELKWLEEQPAMATNAIKKVREKRSLDDLQSRRHEPIVSPDECAARLQPYTLRLYMQCPTNQANARWGIHARGRYEQKEEVRYGTCVFL